MQFQSQILKISIERERSESINPISTIFPRYKIDIFFVTLALIPASLLLWTYLTWKQAHLQELFLVLMPVLLQVLLSVFVLLTAYVDIFLESLLQVQVLPHAVLLRLFFFYRLYFQFYEFQAVLKQYLLCSFLDLLNHMDLDVSFGNSF